MRRAIVILLALSALLAVAGCGSKASPAQQHQAQAEVTKFEAQANKCLPTKDGAPVLTSLKTKAGREKFAACMVPPAQRVTFIRCAESATIGHFSKVKIEQGLNACLEKVS